MRLPLILTCALATCAVGAAPATAAQPHLGTPEVITSFSGESNLLAASSIGGHPDAYAVFHRTIGANVYSVVHRDTHGHAHRFDIPTTRGSYPQAIRIVAIERGGGMALWDDPAGHRVLVRQWRANGSLGPTQVALSQVTTNHSAENDSAQWQVRADRTGTVVVASTGFGETEYASVFGAVRDPGGQFGAQQRLTPAGETGVDQRQIRISPISGDGSVAVAWGPDYGDGPGGRAIRSARAATFGAPTAQPFTAEQRLGATNLSVVADDGAPITITPKLGRLCPCINPHLFRWRGGASVLAFQTTTARLNAPQGAWLVSYAGRDGVFDTAVPATDRPSSRPVRRATPGEIGFADFDTNADYNLVRQRARLVVVAFGPRVPASRRAPRLGFGTFARLNAHRLLVPVFCDRVCGMHGSSGRVGRLSITDSQGRRVDADLEPFTVAYLRITVPAGRSQVRVTLGASDDAGHRAAKRATFVRGRRAGLWCRAGASSC